MRRLELTAGHPKARGKTGTWATNDAMRDAERALAAQAELAYKRNIADWQATRPPKMGASATTRHASTEPQRAKPRGGPQPQTSALRYVNHPRPNAPFPHHPEGSNTT